MTSFSLSVLLLVDIWTGMVLTEGPVVLRVFRNQLKADYLMSLESSEGLLEELGVQVISSGTYSSPQSVTQIIDSVTSSDVVKVSLLTHDESLIY